MTDQPSLTTISNEIILGQNFKLEIGNDEFVAITDVSLDVTTPDFRNDYGAGKRFYGFNTPDITLRFTSILSSDLITAIASSTNNFLALDTQVKLSEKTFKLKFTPIDGDSTEEKVITLKGVVRDRFWTRNDTGRTSTVQMVIRITDEDDEID